MAFTGGTLYRVGVAGLELDPGSDPGCEGGLLMPGLERVDANGSKMWAKTRMARVQIALSADWRCLLKRKSKVTCFLFHRARLHACCAFFFASPRQPHVQNGSQLHQDLHTVKWRPHACPWT